MEIIYLNFFIAFVVGIIFPGYAIFDGKNTLRMLVENAQTKIKIFQITILQLIILMVLCLVPIFIGNGDFGTIGLSFLFSFISVAGIFVFSFLFLWFINKVKLSAKNAHGLLESKAALLMPTNPKEYKLIIVVSFVAGICEEIIYRGYLFWWLQGFLPLYIAILLVNIPFALAHLTTTGLRNTFIVYLLGLIWTGLLIWTGSLWWPILTHIMVDLYSTTFSYKAHRLIHNNHN